MKFKNLRYFYGCAAVRVYGGFTENFINACAQRGISIWDVRHINGAVYFFTREKLLPSVIGLAEESELEIEISSEYGIPQFFRENRRHIVLFAGLVISVIFVGLMNTRVWSVKVSGNEKLFDSEVISVMSDLGVNIGVRKSKLDAIAIQNEFLRIMKDSVLWVSLNVEGMCAEIQLREIERFEDDSTGVPCNLVSDFSGVITTYRVFSGTPVAERGDYVRKGDMLISSVVEYYDKGLDFVESRGKVIARRNKTVKTASPSQSIRRKYTAVSERFSLSVFGMELPLFLPEDRSCETTVTKQFLQLNGVVLPFGIIRYTDSFFEETDDSSAEELFVIKTYLSDLELQTRRSNVISVKTNKSQRAGQYTFTGEIDCLDYMGKKVPVNIEKTE